MTAKASKAIPNTKRQLIAKASSTIFLTVVLASIVISASLVLLKILADQYSFNGRVIKAKEETRDKLITNVENARQLQQSFVALEATDVPSQVVLDALPSRYDFPALASSIEKIVEQSRGGYRLDNFSGEDKSDEAVNQAIDPTPREMPFSVIIAGDYKDIEQFVRDLERSIRPFQVVSMKLAGTNEVLTGNFELKTYYQPAKSLEVTKRSIQ